MKKFAILMIVATMFALGGCTDNHMTRKFGADTEIKLERGQKLMDVVFNTNNVWYLTRKMNANDVAECYKFQEKSAFGVFEGTINICEQKQFVNNTDGCSRIGIAPVLKTGEAHSLMGVRVPHHPPKIIMVFLV